MAGHDRFHIPIRASHIINLHSCSMVLEFEIINVVLLSSDGNLGFVLLWFVANLARVTVALGECSDEPGTVLRLIR